MQDIDPKTLPTQVRRMIRAIGMPATMCLLRWRGGRRLFLPRGPERTELAQVLTREQVQALLLEFNDQPWLDVPKPDKLWLAARDARIRAEHEAGTSLQQLADRYGLTARRVLMIVSESDSGAREEERCERQGRLL
ncbi:MAG: Mor transcription activator family protein [Sinobacteraceae bacterium]|nr:Mor transcription activator family protein [Nevskiaceae bacterium]